MTENHSVMNTMAPRALFMKYLIPSLLGMLLMSVNILVDGLFVSHGLGEHGLAAVNISVPLYSIIFSISLWIGMGGATLYSIALGENNPRKAKAIFTQSMVLTVIITGIILGIGLIFEREIAFLFGANESIVDSVLEYLHVLLLFGVVFVIENILSIFIRNDGNPTLAMLGLIVTAVMNIILNYLFIFVFEFGLEGVAYAIIIAGIIGILVLSTHFLKPQKNLGFEKKFLKELHVKTILIIGLPSFLVEASAAIIVILFNITFNRFMGDTGLASYAVVNYLHTVFLMLFIGVGVALQPITSYLYGALQYQRLGVFLKLALITAIILGVTLMLVGFFGSTLVVKLYGIKDIAVVEYTEIGIHYFFIGYLFLGINMVLLEYYQSIGRARYALMIVTLRVLVFFIPLLLIMPAIFNSNSIWLVFPISEACALAVILVAIKLRWIRLIPRKKLIPEPRVAV